MSGKICAFSNCNNNKRRYPDLSFFSFPSSKKYGTSDRLQQWVKNAGLPDNLPDEVYRANLVCSKHFERWCFANYLCKRLIQSAVPTITTDEVLKREKNGTLPIYSLDEKSGSEQEDFLLKKNEECDDEPELFCDKQDSTEDEPENVANLALDCENKTVNIVKAEHPDEMPAKWVASVNNITKNCRTYSKKTPINIIVAPKPNRNDVNNEDKTEAPAVIETSKRKRSIHSEDENDAKSHQSYRKDKRQKQVENEVIVNGVTHVGAENLNCVETFVIQELKNLEELTKFSTKLDSSKEIKQLSVVDTNQEIKQLQVTETEKPVKQLKSGQLRIVKPKFENMRRINVITISDSKNNLLRVDKQSNVTLPSPIFSTRQSSLKRVTDRLKKRVQNKGTACLKIDEDISIESNEIKKVVSAKVNNISSDDSENKIDELKAQLRFYKSQCLHKTRTIKLLHSNLRKQNLKEILKKIPVSEERKTFAKMQLKLGKSWNAYEKEMALKLHQRFPVSLKYMRDKMGLKFPSEDNLNCWVEEMNSEMCD